jgi:hypothetical protein
MYPLTFPCLAHISNVRGSIFRYVAASVAVSQIEDELIIRSPIAVSIYSNHPFSTARIFRMKFIAHGGSQSPPSRRRIRFGRGSARRADRFLEIS